MGAIFSAFTKPVVQVAAVAAPIPGMGAVADILAAIILLCETVPQNKCVPYLSLFSTKFSLSNSSAEMPLAIWLKDVNTCINL